ncbi:MAG: hypothetical protein A2020_15735 [Lentisphaerae bacterium GWF2_45_14]|nr:MAG: hypothetical protein A2020_15735 [Lentisphaerae bacterium GWF2_45_14]
MEKKPITLPYVWNTPVNCVHPLTAFPYPLGIAAQSITTCDYYFEGRLRNDGNRRCGFQYTLDGSGIFQDSGGEYEIGPGKGFLWQIDDPETIYYYPENSRKPWRFIFITFYNAMDMTMEMCSRFGHVYHLAPENPMIANLRSFSRFDGTMIEMSSGECLNLISGIFAELLASAQENVHESPSTSIARRVKKYIHEHLGDSFTLKDAADFLKISQEHLSRTFKKETGMSPVEYVKNEKIKMACELLKSSPLSCKEILTELGYENSSYFTRIFRKAVGKSPSEYRLKR